MGILLLDDDENLLELTKNLLAFDIAQPIFACTSLSEAINILKNEQLNLVVTDYHLEDTTTINFAKDCLVKNIPVIFCSGEACPIENFKTDYPNCLWITKPFDPDKFVEIIKSLTISDSN